MQCNKTVFQFKLYAMLEYFMMHYVFYDVRIKMKTKAFRQQRPQCCSRALIECCSLSKLYAMFEYLMHYIFSFRISKEFFSCNNLTIYKIAVDTDLHNDSDACFPLIFEYPPFAIHFSSISLNHPPSLTNSLRVI